MKEEWLSNFWARSHHAFAIWLTSLSAGFDDRIETPREDINWPDDD